jgi:RNA polymerase sigma-70 factor (ECF subfamily)
LAALRGEFARDGQGERFELLQAFLPEKRKGNGSYTQVAAELHLSEAAVRQAVRRLRRRFGELVRAEIAQTVAGPEEVEEEMRYLFRALSD